MIRMTVWLTASMALAVSSADAAFLLGNDITGNKKVVNLETQEEHQVLEGIPGQPLPRCPDGAFVLSSDPTEERPVIIDCTTGRSYELGREAIRPVGGYPDGTFFLFGSDGEQQIQMQDESEPQAR